MLLSPPNTYRRLHHAVVNPACCALMLLCDWMSGQPFAGGQWPTDFAAEFESLSLRESVAIRQLPVDRLSDTPPNKQTYDDQHSTCTHLRVFARKWRIRLAAKNTANSHVCKSAAPASCLRFGSCMLRPTETC